MACQTLWAKNEFMEWVEIVVVCRARIFIRKQTVPEEVEGGEARQSELEIGKEFVTGG